MIKLLVIAGIDPYAERTEEMRERLETMLSKLEFYIFHKDELKDGDWNNKFEAWDLRRRKGIRY